MAALICTAAQLERSFGLTCGTIYIVKYIRLVFVLIRSYAVLMWGNLPCVLFSLGHKK